MRCSSRSVTATPSARRWRDLARSPATRGKLRAGGLRVASEHTWERAAIAHERVYRDLLATLGTVAAGRN